MTLAIALLAIGFLFVIISGTANGLKETITHHWTVFAAKYPNANKKCWKPLPDCPVEDFLGSWVNKYVNYPLDKRPRFPGAKTWLAFLTDSYHLLGEIHRNFLEIACLWLGGLGVLATWRNKQFTIYNLIAFVVVFLGVYIVQAAGFYLVYNLIF